MQLQPLYPTLPNVPGVDGPTLPINPNCTRCSRHGRHRCLPADGQPGGLLVLGQGPGRDEDFQGKVFVGSTSIVARSLIAKHWSGPVTWDNAVRCFADGKEITPAQIAQCRPYLTQVVRDARPTRILAMGSDAVEALLGRAVPIMSTRRGYAWVRIEGRSVPVFFTMHVAAGERNHLLRKVINRDIEWALTTQDLLPPPWDGKLHIVESPKDALLAVDTIRCEAPWFAYDMEWAGNQFSSYFEVLTCAVALPDLDTAFVWGRQQLADPDIRAPLLALLADPTMKKVGHNLKADNLSALAAWGVTVKGSSTCTRLFRRLLEADVTADLETSAELVGMGGHKEENEAALAVAKKMISRNRPAQTKKKTEKKPTSAQRSARVKRMVQPMFVDDADPALREAVARPWDDEEKYAYALIPEGIRNRYCARDAIATSRLARVLEPRLAARPQTQRVWDLVVSRATDAIGKMEAWGIAADPAAIGAFDQYIGGRVKDVERRLSAYGSFDPNSPKDIGRFLFDVLKLPSVAQTKTGKEATDQKALKKLASKHVIVSDILEYRKLTKLQSNYGTPLIRSIRADGRIHCELKIDGTRCLPKDELVLTSRGYLPVQDVQIGDTVITHTGAQKRVVETSVHAASPILMVRLSNGLHLRTTENHEYLTDTGWVQAQRLVEGMSIVVHSDREEWRAIEDWPDFAVSSWGRVINIRTQHLAKIRSKGKWGHLKVQLHRNGAQSRCDGDRRDLAVHRLVAIAFHGLPSPEKPEVRHLDGIAWNNTVDNLCWGTTHENRQDALRHGTMHGDPARRKLTKKKVQLIRETPRSLFCDREVAEFVGVSREMIREIRHGRRHIEYDVEGVVAKFKTATVVSVKPSGFEVTYGLTVEDDHSHVTGGIVTHNTGRLSTVNPPLHILPAHSEEGKLVKNSFYSPPEHFFGAFDYKQIEVVIAAMLAQDQVMIELFKSGKDFHLGTAQIIAPKFWGIPADKVTDEHRSKCKAFVFGLLYGMTDQGLAHRLGCSVAEAAKLRAAILGEYVQLAKLAADALDYTRRTGFTWTWWDGEEARLRPLFAVGSSDTLQKRKAENGALNTKIQGCLPPTTRILTQQGLLPIEQAPTFGEVWTGSRWAPYEKLNRGECQLAEIHLANGQILHCDTRHEVLVCGSAGYEFAKYEDLTIGTRVCLSLAQPIDFGEPVPGHPQTAYWMGFAIGNGCTSNGSHTNALHVCFGDRKSRYSKEEKACEFTTFVNEHGIETQAPRVDKNKISIGVENKAFRENWESLGFTWGTTAHHKRIPQSIWSACFEDRTAFILGLLDADGQAAHTNLHMCNEALLREVQILARTIGVESRLFGPYQQKGGFSSWRLDLNSFHATRINYGPGKREIIRDQAPNFIVEQYLNGVAKRGLALGNGSYPTLTSRIRHGGTTSIYTLLKMALAYGIPLQAYATSEVVKTVASPIVTTTYTLSVNDPGHRFDSEGVISKNTANEFSLASICDTIEWIEAKKVPAKLVLTIHDALYVEAHRSVMVEVMDTVQQIMTKHNSMGVPLRVDASWGKTLGSLKKWTGAEDFYRAAA